MWVKNENRLVLDIKFKNFSEAFAFMTKVALLAEKHDHHPTFINTCNWVRLELQTHDAGNRVTDKDYQLADEIDKIFNRP